MRFRFGRGVLPLIALLLVAPVHAQETLCSPGQEPHYVFGFKALHDRLGEKMGDPLTCEFPDRNGTGDVHQQTTKGLSFWRKSTNTPTFTNGHEHWALTERGFVYWQGDSIDPTADAVPATASFSPLLQEHRIVAYYGNPLASVLGILGEPPPEAMLAQLREQADAYATLDPSRPVRPALQLIAVMAQADTGADGLYRARMLPEVIEQVAGWAERCGCLLILDVQPGRSSVQAEVEWLLPYLRRPNVHLALDPEFAMRPGQAPGQAIGSLDAAAINDVIGILADVVSAEGLPPKVLIVHRFLDSMVTRHEAIELDPRVQVVIDMDGFGSPFAKLSKYGEVVRDQPVEYAGIKLFYQYDHPLLTPSEVLGLDPPPDVVIYQ